jgi:hypothetical protein
MCQGGNNPLTSSSPHQLYYVEKSGYATLSLIDNGYGSKLGLYEIGISQYDNPITVKGHLSYDDVKRIIQKWEKNPNRDWEYEEGFY